MSGELIHRSETVWPAITCLSFTPAPRSGILKGWADLHLPRMKLRLRGCPAFLSSEGGASVALPSREIGRDAAGKSRFVPVAEWDNRDIANAFSDAAVAALDAYQSNWREPR